MNLFRDFLVCPSKQWGKSLFSISLAVGKHCVLSRFSGQLVCNKLGTKFQIFTLLFCQFLGDHNVLGVVCGKSAMAVCLKFLVLIERWRDVKEPLQANCGLFLFLRNIRLGNGGKQTYIWHQKSITCLFLSFLGYQYQSNNLGYTFCNTESFIPEVFIHVVYKIWLAICAEAKVVNVKGIFLLGRCLELSVKDQELKNCHRHACKSKCQYLEGKVRQRCLWKSVQT